MCNLHGCVGKHNYNVLENNKRLAIRINQIIPSSTYLGSTQNGLVLFFCVCSESRRIKIWICIHDQFTRIILCLEWLMCTYTLVSELSIWARSQKLFLCFQFQVIFIFQVGFCIIQMRFCFSCLWWLFCIWCPDVVHPQGEDLIVLYW